MIYDANPSLKALFWPRAHADDRARLSDIVVDEERARFLEFLNTAITCEQMTNERFECIADDGRHLRVDFKPSVIRKRDGQVSSIVMIAHDVTEQEQMTRQLEFQARYDELTGLVNRREFSDRLVQFAAKAGFMMYLDLDRFKVVNDSGGHAAGDALLKDVANMLLDKVRSSDTVARLGGDEFAILLGGASREQALACAERIRRASEGSRQSAWPHSLHFSAWCGLQTGRVQRQALGVVVRASLQLALGFNTSIKPGNGLIRAQCAPVS